MLSYGPMRLARTRFRVMAGFVGLGGPMACGDSGSGDDGSEATSVTAATTSATDSTGGDPTTSTTASTSMPADSSGSGASDSSTGAPGDAVTLQNDGFQPEDALFWQTWPSPDDCWASTYEIDPGLYPFDIVGVQVAIGGAPDVATFELGIWEVDGDGLPVQAIDTATVEVTGDVQGPDIDIEMLLDVPTIDSGSFAVVMCHVDHMGSPSIGTDMDGTVDAAHNFVYQQIMGEWVPAPDFFGIDGDFILRTIVRPQ